MVKPTKAKKVSYDAKLFQLLEDYTQILMVGAPACVGLVAPIDVVVPPGNTGLDSSQTSFFQAATDSGTAPEAATKEEEKKEEPAEESNDHMGFSLDFMDSSLSV
ncbi:hypothetical protein JHK82_032109 [Glycine max]|nr:hypothetical protein JHK85_032784 [Glycine max]KAG4995383.1 hypothetical protein JHK86_032210 [Glycine max]KAG5125372.1 hypothetical protein JHK82_032109 [Glycine max]KAG5146806.1 hypothetical protein JHK84_032349 [Glycine max]